MAAVSKAQQIAMAIAEHEPNKLNARNRGLLKMSHAQLHDFAATTRTGLPDRAKGVKRLADQLTSMRRAGRFQKAA